MKHVLRNTSEVEIEQFPCIKCGFSGKLDFWQDRKYDTAYATCPQCKASYKKGLSWDKGNAEIINEIWNPANSRDAYIENLTLQIGELPKTKKRLQSIVASLRRGKFLNEIEEAQ